ncbi:MAG: hypothetical protein AAB587_01960 [Patescibacteria group bacterium]
MGIAASLKALGISIEDPRSVAEGINRLLITREQKLKLFREYAIERGIRDTKIFEDFLSG